MVSLYAPSEGMVPEWGLEDLYCYRNLAGMLLQVVEELLQRPAQVGQLVVHRSVRHQLAQRSLPSIHLEEKAVQPRAGQRELVGQLSEPHRCRVGVADHP